MRASLLSLFLSMCFLVAGCDQAAFINKIASEQEQAFARQQVERLRARQFEAIEAAQATAAGSAGTPSGAA